jgi:flagellin
MNSINTNVAAMAALQSLNATNKQLETTQNRISTGFSVGSAADNAAYWSMATTLRSDNKSLSAVSDALGLGGATLDVAYTGMNSAIDVVTEMKAKLVAVSRAGRRQSKSSGRDRSAPEPAAFDRWIGFVFRRELAGSR